MNSKFYGNQIELKNQNQNSNFITPYRNPSQFDIINSDILDLQQQYFGKHIPFCFVKGKPMFTIGPHFCCFLLAFVCFLSVGLFISLKNENQINYFTLSITLCQSVCYLFTAFLNPGICCDREVYDIELQVKVCKICHVRKFKERNHCSDCEICIEGMDHHCPWTGKCVGEGNICAFYLFIFFTIVYFISMFTAK